MALTRGPQSDRTVRIIELYNRGWGYGTIARELKVHKSTVRNAIQRHIPPQYRR